MNSIKKSNGIGHKYSRGFTLIEILIVIVIIGILVIIATVTYNNRVNSAKEVTLLSDLRGAAGQLESERMANDVYPSNANGLKRSDGTSLEITSDGTTYCLTAVNKVGAYYITNDNTTPREGFCANHVDVYAPEIANNTPIQDITRRQCQALPVYDGTNDSALRTLTDNRDGTTRSYRIAKLADNKCWMLDNLKLGKTTGTTTLTPANTNIATNFTLPQLITTGTASYDIPQAAGPVPGDTGAGATNYGYLYNWPAATAGETQTTMPAGSGDAQYSICPKSWRLPTGGINHTTDWLPGPNNDFNNLSAHMAGFTNNQDPAYLANYWDRYQGWQSTGPFKGVFSGTLYDSFYYQSSWGGMWSRSASPSTSYDAFIAYFDSSNVINPGGNGDDRSNGFAVRCLLN